MGSCADQGLVLFRWCEESGRSLSLGSAQSHTDSFLSLWLLCVGGIADEKGRKIRRERSC